MKIMQELNWPAELRLVAALSRNPGAPNSDISADQLTRLDWTVVKALAKRHRTEALIAVHLNKHKYEGIPQDIFDHFGKQLKRHTFKSLQTARATLQALTALSARDIPSLVMKGPAVAERFYPVPTARQTIDTDILIDEANVKTARTVVEHLGFRQYFPNFEIPETCEDTLLTIRADLAYQRPADGVQLELHWRWTRNPHMLDWQFEDAAGMSTLIPFANADIRILKAPALLTYLIGHGSKHAWFRLKWLADIDRMLPQLSGEEIEQFIKLARETGLERMTASALKLTSMVYATPIPEALSTEFSRDEKPFLTRHILKSIVDEPQEEGIRVRDLNVLFRSLLFQLRLKRDPRYKSFVLLRFLIDPRDMQTLKLSKKWLWVYVLLSPVLSLGRAFKLEARALKNKPNQ